MEVNKKLNLLPQEVKDNYANKYIVCASACIGAILVLALAVQYIGMGYLSWQIQRVKAENERYTAQKEKITKLRTDIDGYMAFVNEHGNGYFPFSRFMRDLEANRPDGVSMISVDSADRLVNEGERKEEQKQEKTEITDQNSSKQADTEKDAGKDVSEPENTPEPAATITYTSDLAGQELTIRGYGKNQADISKFIYAMSGLSYISSVKITAIEEHPMPDGVYNIFDIKVVGGAS